MYGNTCSLILGLKSFTNKMQNKEMSNQISTFSRPTYTVLSNVPLRNSV